MNKILVVLFSVFMALSAAAQKVVVVRPPVVHTVPRAVYYPRPYYYNPYYFGFNYEFNMPAYYHYNRPTKLDRQVQDIENEYADRIKSLKADDSLSHHERREKIRDIKHERDQAISDAKKNYYKQYED